MRTYYVLVKQPFKDSELPADPTLRGEFAYDRIRASSGQMIEQLEAFVSDNGLKDQVQRIGKTPIAPLVGIVCTEAAIGKIKKARIEGVEDVLEDMEAYHRRPSPKWGLP